MCRQRIERHGATRPVEPTVHARSHHNEHVVPYEIMCWFMEQMADHVERCRGALTQEDPEAVG